MESYLIGTLFEEEEKEQKQNFYNQIARDDKGHKRFHGAFTGGFEAGYKNTCGSKEGWVPTQFISSRNNRVKQQSILEFMDEEDLGKTIAGETLVTKTDFSDPLGIQSKEIVKNSLGMSFLGDIPNELIVQNQTSIGRNMFNQMKIKEKKEKKQSENYLKNFSGPFREENKNNYDPMISVKYKDNYFGVGFDVLNYTPYEGDEIFEEEFNSLLKLKNMNKSEKDIEIEKEKEKKKQRIHFSNFNQKGEVELDEEYSNYEINTEEIEILKGMHNKNTNLSNNIKIENYLSKYEILPVPLQSKVRLNSIVIPPDYDPYKKIKEYQKNKINHPNFTVKKIKRDLNPEQREYILGEKEDSIEIQQQTFKQNLTEDKKNKILNVKQFVKGSEQDMDGDHIENIFKNDKDKKQRYLNFCYEMEGKVVGGIPPANNMTHELLQKEIKEFEEIYSMFKNFKKTMKECKQDKILNQIDELKKKIEEEKGKRNVERWIPDKLLCKRFGVPQPYQGKVYKIILLFIVVDTNNFSRREK